MKRQLTSKNFNDIHRACNRLELELSKTSCGSLCYANAGTDLRYMYSEFYGQREHVYWPGLTYESYKHKSRRIIMLLLFAEAFEDWVQHV